MPRGWKAPEDFCLAYDHYLIPKTFMQARTRVGYTSLCPFLHATPFYDNQNPWTVNPHVIPAECDAQDFHEWRQENEETLWLSGSCRDAIAT